MSPRTRSLVMVVLMWAAAAQAQEVTFTIDSAATGGTTATGKVTLPSPVPAGGNLTISTVSNKPSVARVGASFTIPGGQRSGSFPITTFGVAGPVDVAITASAGAKGLAFSQTRTIRVFPPSLSSLTLSPVELVGGVAVRGKLQMNGPAPTGGMPITTSSSDPAVQAPPTVTIPAGAREASFIFPSTNVTAGRSATISASLRQVTKTAAVTLKPLAISRIALSSADLRPGSPVTAIIELNAPGSANTGGFGFNVATNSLVRFTGTQTVPAGSNRINLQLSAGTVSTPTATTIAIQGQSATAQLTVHPAAPEITELRVPARVYTLKTKPLGGLMRFSGFAEPPVVAQTTTMTPGDIAVSFQPALLKLARTVNCTRTDNCLFGLDRISTTGGSVTMQANQGIQSKTATIEVIIGTLTVTTDKRSYVAGENVVATITTNVPASEWPNGQLRFGTVSQGSGDVFVGGSKLVPVVAGQPMVVTMTVAPTSNIQLGMRVGVIGEMATTIGTPATIDWRP